jgi:predicted RNA polymerase sigma factor
VAGDGVPRNPGAWLTTTANRKAIDRIRRENKRDDKQKEAQMVYDDDPPEPLGAIDDERLRLIFTRCPPTGFNEGYLATGPDTDPVRHDLTAEAIRLTRLIRAVGDREI